MVQRYNIFLIYARKYGNIFAYVKKKQYLCSRKGETTHTEYMKRIGYIVLLLVLSMSAAWADDKVKPGMQIEDNTFFDPTAKTVEVEPYQFGMEYRVEAGYAQHWQRAHDITFPDRYLHGVRLGASFTFLLPKHFSMQTGVYYTLLYGRDEQHWRSLDLASMQKEYITHRVLAHNITIPVRAYYTIPLWKQLNLFFYTGPQLHIGLAQTDYMDKHLSAGAEAWLLTQGIPTDTYDRMADELIRANIQWGLGGGIEWDCYRLQGGYDFGLNNLVKQPIVSGRQMWEWGWHVAFSYRF